MRKKSAVFVIGSGLTQIPLIKEAKKRGYFVISTDRNGNAPGFAFSDEKIVIDALNLQGLEAEAGKRAEKHNIECFVTDSYTKVALSAVYLNEVFGKACQKYNPVRNLSRKDFIRNKCKGRIAEPEFRIVDDMKDALSATGETGTPAVMKPVDNVGGRGAVVVNSAEDAETHFDSVWANSETKKILVEKFIDGIEVGVTGIVSDSVFHPLCFYEEEYSGSPYFLQTGEFTPAGIDGEIRERISGAMRKISAIFSLENTVVCGEFRIKDGTPYLIDFGLESGGRFVSEMLIPLSTGRNMAGLIIDTALGRDVVIRDKKEKSVLHRYIRTGPGGVSRISGIKEAGRIKGVKYASVNFKEGDFIGGVSNWIGDVVVSAKDRDECESVMKKAFEKLKIPRVSFRHE